MRFLSTVSAAALAVATASVASATPLVDAMPPMSEFVKRDLLARDPSTYQTYHLTNETTVVNKRGAPGKRAAPSGLNGLLTRPSYTKAFGFTFDDGVYQYHKQVADTLNNNGIKGTFFVNGNNYQCIYDTSAVSALRYSYAQGHTICSHTWGHVHLNDMTNAQIDRQVQLVEDALYKILGIVPACIRPPYGEANDRVVKYLNDKWGLAVINWTVDSGDSQGATVAQSLDVYRGLKAPAHHVVLNHEVYAGTAQQMLPKAISIVKQNGYPTSSIQGVGTLYKFNPYKVVGTRGSRDASWTCEGKPAPGQG